MTDTQSTPPKEDWGAPGTRAAWNARIVFGSIALAFCMGMVAFTTLAGETGNSLHSSAQSWSFALIGAILLGFGVGSMLEPVLLAMGKGK